MSARAEFDACFERGTFSGNDLPALTNALQIAIGAQRFATEYGARCRNGLAESLDRLGSSGARPADPGSAAVSREAGSAAVVLAEATSASPIPWGAEATRTAAAVVVSTTASAPRKDKPSAETTS